MAADLMTLDEAATKAGYAQGHAGNLRRAAATNKLRTIRRGWQRFTTEAWLDEYLTGLRHTNARTRGERKPRPAKEQP